jgi:hypothetical protein
MEADAGVCEECRFYVRFASSPTATCTRFPLWAQTVESHWCGEFSRVPADPNAGA